MRRCARVLIRLPLAAPSRQAGWCGAAQAGRGEGASPRASAARQVGCGLQLIGLDRRAEGRGAQPRRLRRAPQESERGARRGHGQGVTPCGARRRARRGARCVAHAYAHARRSTGEHRSGGCSWRQHGCLRTSGSVAFRSRARVFCGGSEHWLTSRLGRRAASSPAFTRVGCVLEVLSVHRPYRYATLLHPSPHGLPRVLVRARCGAKLKRCGIA